MLNTAWINIVFIQKLQKCENNFKIQDCKLIYHGGLDFFLKNQLKPKL